MGDQRQDTCRGKECPFWKRYGEYCPNFVEGEWENKERIRYTTKDCAPKRAMLMSQQIYAHITDARRDYNQMRNATKELLKLAYIDIAPVPIEIIDTTAEEEKIKQIEN